MQTAGILGLMVVAAACSDRRFAGPKNPEPPRIATVLAALDTRAETCRQKGGTDSPAKCIAASAPVVTEPELCAEYQERATTEHNRDGSESVVDRGTWRELPNWELIRTALLEDLPVIGAGKARARPLASTVPSNLDAPLPRAGHFLPAFSMLGRYAATASPEELADAEREAQSVEQIIDAKLSWKTAPSMTPIRWSRYSRGCMEIITTAAAVLEHDLGQATSSVRYTRERSDVAMWLKASLAQCDTQVSDAGCTSPPAFATTDDRATCTAECTKRLDMGVERAFKDAVRMCGDAYSKSEEKPVSASCTFVLPPGSTAVVALDARAPACTAACEAAGKQYLAEADERARAKKESAYLLYAFKGCMRAAQKSPEHAKARAGDKTKYDKAVAQETKACRYQSKCDWLEKFTEKQCKSE